MRSTRNIFFIVISLLCCSVQVSGQEALDFDGNNDYVSVPDNSSLNVSDFTLESWINLSSTGGSRTILSKGDGGPGSSTNYIFNVGGVSGDAKLGLYAGGDWYSATTPLTTGVWYHVAVTVSGSLATFYLNGVNDGTATLSGPVSTAGGHSFQIGTQGDACHCNSLYGTMDEVRVWNVARSPSQIQGAMSTELNAASYSSLVAYYQFNQGTPNGDNTAISTVTDSKGSNNGTLNNFALTGTTSNFVDQTVVLPVKWEYVTAAVQNNSILVKWATATEQNTKDYTVEHSPDGQHWNSIAFITAAGNSTNEKIYSYLHRQPVAGINYYRILQEDMDGHISYSETIHVRWMTATQAFVLKSTLITDGTLRVRVNKDAVNLFIYTMQGKLILKKYLPAGEQAISVLGYSKGMYLVKAEGITEKIVIE